MTCKNMQIRPDAREDYVNGSLPSAEAAGLELHLVGCGVCREEVAAAREAGQLLRAAFAPAGEVSGAFWTRLRAQLREEEGRLATGGDFWNAVEHVAWRLSFGAAALVVLLVGIVIGTQLPAQAPESAGVRVEAAEIFPEPARQAVDSDDVLFELAAGSRNGR